MKDEKNKIKEPFPADHTPTPPDHSVNPSKDMDPNQQNPRSEVRSKPDSDTDKKKETSSQDTGKRLGDETEITDETTI
ncbi:hypothetical protein [Chryseosolibacter indicus]|uniref:Uncharacterized protein n=1 Tax=Chryseosolibacter indicus TaxID=2782351 RepID=A0ABS5VNH8_9BACT|nr:hypothetical protein [Chryseosolibacter indicus]MBT1702395.1 hypothetical protein [Chryseosolibacter indicus]